MADREMGEISSRSPVRVHKNLDFLKANAHNDSSSAQELAKFGF